MRNTNTVSHPLLDVALRIREMREIVGYSVTEMAEKTEISEQLYQEYRRLHDYFGRGENDVMKRLKAIKAEIN